MLLWKAYHESKIISIIYYIYYIVYILRVIRRSQGRKVKKTVKKPENTVPGVPFLYSQHHRGEGKPLYIVRENPPKTPALNESKL